jgi:dipeptidyl aminopeptidase/acylaminoacyl peptidase
MSWENMPPLLSSYGIGSVLFDFEGLGRSDGKREDLTLTIGIANFRSVFSTICQEDWIDRGNVGFLASSFGANVALLVPEITNSIKALGLKSPACFLPDAYRNEISQSEFEEWSRKGFSKSNGYKYEVYLDPFNYDTYESASRIYTSCLITHGSIDEIVPLQQSKLLFEKLAGEKKLEILYGASHGYSEEGQWQKMADLFISFFTEKLR